MSFLRNITLIVSLILITECMASSAKAITCEYNYGREVVTFGVGKSLVTIEIKRKINNLQYQYHIQNIDKFDEVEDYVEITNKDGKNIIYSLKCK